MGKRFPNGSLSIALVVACLVPAACKKASQTPECERIAFKAGIESLSDRPGTKAPVTPVTSLEKFYVTASIGLDMKEQQVFGNEPFVYDPESGYYISSRYWPAADEGYHFYASNLPINFAFKGDFYLDAGVDVDAVSAYVPFGTWMAVNNLTFRHLLSRVGTVTVKPQQIGKGNTDYYDISEIVINIIPETHGHYILGDNLWEKTSSDNVPRNMATSVAVIPDSAPYFTQENDIWALPGKVKALLSYKAVYQEWYKTYTDIPVKINLRQGCVNDITFELGGDPVDITFTVTVRDWNDIETDIEFMEP